MSAIHKEPALEGVFEQARGAAARADLGDLEGLITRMRGGDREAAARFLVEYGDLIRRRIRGKLGTGMRRLYDSQDILSTVSRRLDRYVRNGQVQAASAEQLWSLVFKMAETAVIDRVRAYKRLQAAEGEDGTIARELLTRMDRAESNEPEGAELVLERVYCSLGSDADRELLVLWLADMPLFRIAETTGSTPAAIRQRWKAIRERLKVRIAAGEL
jgi:hypothetical protein